MKVVIIGPGRVGCGFAGQLMRASGYALTFIGRDSCKLARLNETGCYRVRLSNGADASEIMVSGVQAVSVRDRDRAVEQIAQADVVATAVGPGNLSSVASLIAEGLERRQSPVNVLAFENLADAGQRLRRLVARRLGRHRTQAHGFAGALVFRAISQLIMDPDQAKPITLIGDLPATFVVDGRELRDPQPRITGMKIVGNYEAHVRRKLFTFSAGHAACAYLGYLKGYRYVHAAVRDPEIRAIVLQAMKEGHAGLTARYGAALAGDRSALAAIMRRFDNAVLNDPVTRVARDPCRKLAPCDRLIGAARLASQGGINPTNLAVAVAAALHYRNPADPGAVSLGHEIDTRGVQAAIKRICAIGSANRLGRLIIDSYERFAHGWHQENLLIDVGAMMWACQAPALQNETSECRRLTRPEPSGLMARARGPE